MKIKLGFSLSQLCIFVVMIGLVLASLDCAGSKETIEEQVYQDLLDDPPEPFKPVNNATQSDTIPGPIPPDNLAESDTIPGPIPPDSVMMITGGEEENTINSDEFTILIWDTIPGPIPPDEQFFEITNFSADPNLSWETDQHYVDVMRASNLDPERVLYYIDKILPNEQYFIMRIRPKQGTVETTQKH